MCMFRHNDEEDENEEDDSDSLCSEVNIDKLELVLEKVKKAVEKCDNLMKQCSLNCKMTDFEAKDKKGLAMHTKHARKAN